MAVFVITAAVIIPYGLLMLRFSLRNDQMDYFLPFRMYLSDAFNHHEFMLWNPFMSGSYPAHCDMQGSSWNPIVTLLAWLFNYNASLLSVELLLYYVIGAIGCFYFARNFCEDLRSCVVIAVIYGCGGFATSIMEFMSWVGSFAFLPWAAHFFYLLLKRQDVYASICLAIALWLMLVCGYPSFGIYLGYCMIALTLAYFYHLYSQRRYKEIFGIIRYGALAMLLFVIISLPAIHSFYEYLPYYGRGKRATDVHIDAEFFSWSYLSSLVLPVSGILTWDNNFYNNVYIGVLPVLALWCVWKERGGHAFRDRILLVGALFTFLFTLGRSTPVRMWCARHLPLMDAFGFSHSVSVFLLLAAFVWLAPKLDVLFSGEHPSLMRTIRLSVIGAVLVLIVCFVGEYHWVMAKKSLVRWFYYGSALWQLFLLGALYFSPRVRSSPNRLVLFILADLSLSTLTIAPLTGFTLTAPGVYNKFAEKFYQSDARDALAYPGERSEILPRRDPHTQINAFKSVSRRNFPSHTRMEVYYNYVLDKERCKKICSMPFVFAKDSTLLHVRDIELGYNFINVDVNAEDSCQMVIRQNYYSRWRSRGPEFAPSAWEGMFLQVPLRKGENRVRLYYYSRDLLVEAAISILTLFGLGIILFLRHRGLFPQMRRNKLKKRIENF